MVKLHHCESRGRVLPLEPGLHLLHGHQLYSWLPLGRRLSLRPKRHHHHCGDHHHSGHHHDHHGTVAFCGGYGWVLVSCWHLLMCGGTDGWGMMGLGDVRRPLPVASSARSPVDGPVQLEIFLFWPLLMRLAMRMRFRLRHVWAPLLAPLWID